MLLSSLLRRSGAPDAEVSVLFIGDRAMRSLNRTWRGIDRTTDVLSFSQREGRFPLIQPQLLGDIVISLPQAERQARNAGHAVSWEINCLLVHGLLHLLGYDHEKNAADAAIMQRRERLLLSRTGR
ncbi:MAG TPA: rRNA maturation RNase YbeY [Nitrospirota bacterium]|nr:rRNA maturation RNase YbeY [Nitrospirota bacterium]